jgi:tRNA 2-selenouridine synthase
LIETYGHYNSEDLKAATLRIQKRLGGLETKNTIHFLETGDTRNAFSILLKYYDKVYLRASSQRNPENILKIDSSTTRGNINADLLLKMTAQMSAYLSV